MSEPLEFVDRFKPGGELDERQPRPPWHHMFEVRLGLGLAKMHAEDAPALRDVDTDGRPGADFWLEFAKGVRAVDAEAAKRHQTGASTAGDWGELFATWAMPEARTTALLRLGGKLLHHQLPAEAVLALMLSWNRSMCLPPMQPFEVEALWRWLRNRHQDRA